MTMTMRTVAVTLALTTLACGGDRSAAAGVPSAESAPRVAGAAATPTTATTPDGSCGVGNGVGALASGRVGALRVGEDTAQVRAGCTVARDTVRLDAEALPERVLTVRTPHGDVEAIVDSGRVWRLEVESPALRTRDGLGVGSSLADLLRAQGARGVEGEAGLFVTLAGACGLSFRLAYDVPDDAHQDTWTATALARLPAATHVDRVLAFDCSTDAAR